MCVSIRYVLFLLCLGVLLFSVPAVAREFVYGTVLDAATDRPLRGATVTCGEEHALTDHEGRYRIRAAGFGLAARAPGYRRAEQNGSFPPIIHLAPFSPKAAYLSFYGVAAKVLRQPVLELIEQSELNALVVDVKGDRGMIAYPSSIPLAKSVGAQQVTTVKDPAGMLQSFKERGIYTIARIVVFKDHPLATANPDLAVKTEAGTVWRDGEGLAWADPFRREAWDYNIDIAIEAAKYGFDEIQFDYVRFPDRAGLRFSKENTEENRVAAISGFLAAAREHLRPYNVFLAADIFGYACWERNDTWIGQRLEDLAPNVDYLSPMVYPSGFQHGIGEYRNPLEYPYEIVLLTLKRASERSGLAPVRFRPWLQAFRDYAFDKRPFTGREVRAQTSASDDFGSNGWMLWSPANVYSAEWLGQLNAQAEEIPDSGKEGM